MSRTDAHRPIRVWLNDHPELAAEVHRHEAGVCDLPERPSASATRCRWVLAEPPPWPCRCLTCGGHFWRRHDVRRRRARERVLLGWRTGDEETWERLEADWVALRC